MKKRFYVLIATVVMTCCMISPALAVSNNVEDYGALPWSTVSNKFIPLYESLSRIGKDDVSKIGLNRPTNVVVFKTNGYYLYSYITGTPQIKGAALFGDLTLSIWRVMPDLPNFSFWESSVVQHNGFHYIATAWLLQNKGIGLAGEIVASSCDIYDSNGNKVIDKSFDYVDGGSDPDKPSYDLDNDWLTNTKEEGIYIVAPKDGKVFTLKDPAVNITVQYRAGTDTSVLQTLYFSTDGTTYEKLDKINPNIGGFSGVVLSHDTKLATYDNKMYEEGTIVYKLNVRKNIKLSMYAAMGHKSFLNPNFTEDFQSNKISLTWYDDFIDEDGDGNDDRDPDPDYHPSQDDELDKPDLSGLGSITDVLNSLKGTLSGFISFLTNFFKFIPSPIFVLLGVGVALTLLLRIFGR